MRGCAYCVGLGDRILFSVLKIEAAGPWSDGNHQGARAPGQLCCWRRCDPPPQTSHVPIQNNQSKVDELTALGGCAGLIWFEGARAAC